MPASEAVTGMVLSAMPIGEYDKRLVILTKELGKISAFAKGARRPNSALLACSQPFAFGQFSLYVGKSSYNIVSAEISNYFGELREDFENLCYGFYFCEVADYFTKENNDEKDVLKLLYQTLRALSKRTIEKRLIRAVFELKMITLNGEGPEVFNCVKCSRNSPRSKEMKDTTPPGGYYFSVKNRGILCAACASWDKEAIAMDTSTLYTLQYIVSKEIEKLYTFRVSDAVLKELETCIGRYLDCYIDHEFKSLEMLNSIV